MTAISATDIVLTQLRARGPLLPAEIEAVATNYDHKNALDGYTLADMCGPAVVMRSRLQGGVEYLLAEEDSLCRKIGHQLSALTKKERLLLREHGDRLQLASVSGVVQKQQLNSVFTVLLQSHPRGVSAFTIARLYNTAADEMRALLDNGAAFSVGTTVWLSHTAVKFSLIEQKKWLQQCKPD